MTHRIPRVHIEIPDFKYSIYVAWSARQCFKMKYTSSIVPTVLMGIKRKKAHTRCAWQNQRQRFLYAYAFNENRMNAKLNGDAEQRIGTTISMNNVCKDQRHTKEHIKCIYQNTKHSHTHIHMHMHTLHIEYKVSVHREYDSNSLELKWKERTLYYGAQTKHLNHSIKMILFFSLLRALLRSPSRLFFVFLMHLCSTVSPAISNELKRSSISSEMEEQRFSIKYYTV